MPKVNEISETSMNEGGPASNAETFFSSDLQDESNAESTLEGKRPPPSLKPGDRINSCIITRFVSCGGMGEVYEARHETLERRVAIKLIREKYAKDPKYRNRFLREAKVAARFTHPHLAIVFDAGEDGEQLYVVMEFLEGEDVAVKLGRLGSLPNEQALRICRDVAEGLAVAHDKGLVHRDVKPSNIMITADGSAKLMDFGLVQVREPGAFDKTDAGTVIGTPRYMSPEQWNEQELDGRSDLYGLGVTLYEMLSGRCPTSGSSLGEICKQTTTHQLVPLREQLPGLDSALIVLVESLIAPLDQRCPSARELIKSIDGFLTRAPDYETDGIILENDSTTEIPVGALRKGEQEGSKAGGSWLLVAAAAGILLLGALVYIFGFEKGSVSGPVEKVAFQVESGHEKGAGSPEMNAIGLRSRLKLDWTISGLRKTGVGDFVDIDLVQSPRLKSGERFQMRIKPSQTCYVYALMVTSQNESILLYPSSIEAALKKNEGGVGLNLPESTKYPYYELDRHPGKERILLAASYEPLDAIVGLLRRQAQYAETTNGKGPSTDEWLSVFKEAENAPAELTSQVDTTRGLAGVTTGRPVQVHLPDGKVVTRLPRQMIGGATLLNEFVIEHLP